MGQVKVFISSTSTISSTETKALWDGVVTWEQETPYIFYRAKVGEMLFREDDFCLIESAGECEEISVAVDTCDATYWRGKFTKFNCKFDLDKKEVRVTPETVDLYTCLLENWQKERNIYNSGQEIEARGVIGRYEAGLFPCYECRSTPSVLPCNDHSGEACLEYSRIVSFASPKCPSGQQYEVNTMWHREVGTGTPTTPPPYYSGWQHLGGNDWWRCPSTGNIALGVFRWGRKFADVLEYLIGLISCQSGNPIVVKSHFFDINATHGPAPVNDAYTFSQDYLREITLHQKSDVKRPDGNKSFSKVWVMKPQDLLDDLDNMMNLQFKMSGTFDNPEIIIEHSSYWTAGIGIDISGQKIRRQFKQDDGNSPKEETWKWSDDVQLLLSHSGFPVQYNCGGKEATNRVKLFTNDLVNIKSSVNAEDINDRNYSLIANFLHNSQRLIYPENAPLGFQQLHDKLHRHNRYFRQGKLNNANATFLSWKKLRRLSPVTIPWCCATFSPEAGVLTSLGPATIQKAVHNLYRDTMTLDLNI